MTKKNAKAQSGPASAEKKQRSTQFKKGQSGNPRGRKPGTRNKATILAQSLLNGEVEAVIGKLLELAKEGNMAAIKLITTRLLPPVRERLLNVALPKTGTPEELEAAHDKLIEMVGQGQLTSSEAITLSTILKERRMARESSDFEQRLTELEEKLNYTTSR